MHSANDIFKIQSDVTFRKRTLELDVP